MWDTLILGYRTVSEEAANLLAGLTPWDLEARVLATLYRWRGEALRWGETPLPRQIAARWTELRRDHMAIWKERLLQPSAGHTAIAAVRPLCQEWLERCHGVLRFRLTQVLTGHGYFSRFLHRIKRDETSGYHHCVDRPEDMV